MYVVYLLTDPRDGEIRYVGKTCRPMARFWDHRNARNQKSRCLNWEKSLLALGLSCDIIIVECDLAADDAVRRECWWIALGRKLGWRLTNLTDGGEGAVGYRHPPELVERLRQGLIGRRLSPESIAKRTASVLGSKRSEETRARMRTAQRGHRPTAQCFERARAASRRKHTPEEIEKRRRAITGIKRSDHTNRLHGLLLRGRKRTAEQIERIRRGALSAWARRKGQAA